jgi:adenylate cyclase
MLPARDDLLRRIQEAVAAETGVQIDLHAASRLRTVMRTAPVQSTTQEVSVLLADLRGFTAITEANAVDTVLDVLNRYLARMCEIAIANGGTIDKFMGDAVMVLFGAPDPSPDDARNAVLSAVQMQIAMGEINREHAERGLPLLYMGAGINTGYVMAGLLGSSLHSEYTVIGNEVNIASRIETFSLRGQVLISDATYARCSDFIETSEPMEVVVKGKSQPVRLREVLGVPSMGLAVPRQDVRKSPRVDARIPFTYQRVVDKIVVPSPHHGVVLDISYEGVLASVEAELTAHQDIVLELDLTLVGGQSQAIYGRVRSVRSDGERHFAGIEFTSIDPQYEQQIRRFVQFLIQGGSKK